MSTTETISIQPIDETTVNQICSGQVVLNLATAVKELLENSIDAGADSIQVKLEGYGNESIEVIDNGCGVEEINFQALTLKHHTSKIREFSDLSGVETFGFRGEALSSLCSLSDVTIITQHKNASIGAILKFDHNGIITSKVKTLRKTGTTVRLENLFNTLPIRRTEFLKNLKREYSKMCNILYAYGLLSKGIRITCTNNVYKSKLTTKEIEEKKIKRPTTSLIMDTKGDSLESNIASIFGIKQKQNLLKITEKIPSQETLSEFNLKSKTSNLQKFKLNGYISSCAHGCGRASSDRQFYYINSRPVDYVKISKLVNEIYHQYNNRQDPFVVLNITVACNSFDVNVTPDKRQILLQNEKLLFAVLKETLNAAFQKIPSTLEIQNVGSSNGLLSTDKMEIQDGPQKCRAGFDSSLGRNEKKEQTQSRIDNLLKFHLIKRSSTKISAIENPHEKCFIKPEEKLQVSKHTDKNEILVGITSQENIPNSIHTEREPKSASDETGSLNEPMVIEKCEKNFLEIPYDRDLSWERVSVENDLEATKAFCQNEIKLTERFQQKNTSILNELVQSDAKRMKFDEGLAPEDKKKRKTITFNITLAEIKKLGLRAVEKDSYDTEVNSEVKFFSEIKPQTNERAEDELRRELKKDSFKEMEIIGQFNLGFIITKLDFDIFIIDQHASDEKYNYETLQEGTIRQIQKLFNPEKLELTADKEELMLRHKSVFEKNGFDFVYDKDALSTKRISLTSLPMSKNYVFNKNDVDELLFLLEDTVDVSNIRPSKVNSIFASTACRKSVMIGTALNQQEMKKIVVHMGEMQHPWNCPHGRPTMRHLVNLQMIRFKE